MKIREKTYAVIRAEAARKKEERQDIVAALRQDEKFDELLRSANALRWDRVLQKGEEKEKAEALLQQTEEEIKKYLFQKGYTEDVLYDTASSKLCNETGVYQ